MEPEETNHEKWNKATPKKLPRPTYWPFFLALGLAFAMWGLIAGWIIFIAGCLLAGVAISGWINILRHEYRRHKNKN